MSVFEVRLNLKDKNICSDVENLKFYICSLLATQLPNNTGNVGLSESLYQISHLLVDMASYNARCIHYSKCQFPTPIAASPASYGSAIPSMKAGSSML